MANVSNASFLFYGHNASTEILHGQLDQTHNSTLSAYWFNYPTPWPYLLTSVAISIGLGWHGFRSSAKSWQPVHKKKHQHILLPSIEVDELAPHDDDAITPEPTPQPQFCTDRNNYGFFRGLVARQEHMRSMTKEERRAYAENKNNTLIVDAQHAVEAEYADNRQTFDPADDIRPDGGVGKFNMYITILGICWTSVRALSVFALAMRIAHGSDSNSSYPGPLSIMILFASAQTYLAGRGMPRLFNVVLAYDLVLIWIAFVLSSFGPGSTVKYYGKIGVQGGNCPFFDRDKYTVDNNCDYGRWPTVGCATNSTWDISAHKYPRVAWWFTGSPDPNTYGNSRLFSIAYGLIALFLSLPMYFLPFAWRLLGKPLPAVQLPFLRRVSYTMSMASFVLVLILSIIAVPLHISGELDPPKWSYVDSTGPLIDARVFNSDNAQTAIDGTWPSLGWNQSHEGTGDEPGFLGGNQTSWSDCFLVQAPKLKTGHLSAWWHFSESRALRVLAGL